MGKKKTPASKSRHKWPAWGFRLPKWYRDYLREIAKENRRTDTEELKIALESHFKAQGKQVPPS